MLPSIILLEDDCNPFPLHTMYVLLPSIILLEDDIRLVIDLTDLVLLPSIILLEDDSFSNNTESMNRFATIYYFARR